MKAPTCIMAWTARLIKTVPDRRSPDVVIGDDPDQPYLRRWWLVPRNPLFNVYLHEFRRPDDARVHHDHPWLFNLSFILRGGYIEHFEHRGQLVAARREAGHLYGRLGAAPHRIELHDLVRRVPGADRLPPGGLLPQPVWTLFITGPRFREWGFLCPQGWVHHRRFTRRVPGGNAEGQGCAG